MGNVQLLDRTRKIARLLHENNEGKVLFDDICRVICDCMAVNCIVLSRKGKILGIQSTEGLAEIVELLGSKVGDLADSELNDRFLEILSTKENVNLETLGFDTSKVPQYRGLVTPILVAGDRLGTLFMYRESGEFDIDDIILCEYSTSVIGLEMLRSVSEEISEENRRIQGVKSAISSLSTSEYEAIVQVFEELNGMEGILVASKVADRLGITRSVIVNALRKLESAGVIEAKSSGMKGTYIKVMNDAIFDEIGKT
ncbi:MAG: GTP-sensing pleiotropic transcriptional regulator CodY [Lachnospiraceae bacterium]|nr:GTP-sensing pleiotropic transcriptional regulator CodY [Lachnospiraceae bacterium]